MITKTPGWYDITRNIYCVTCSSQLIDSGQRCSRCHTPICVSKSVSQRGADGKLVSVLGASGAGKTVYLGMLLDMLSKGLGGIRGLPNGGYSLNIQQQTMTALENRRFPDKTPAEADKWNWLHCEAFEEQRPKRRIEIITPDVAGEVLAQELEQNTSSHAIRSLISNSRGMMVLLDSERIRDDAGSEDIFAVKLVTYIAELHEIENERRKKFHMPVAFVLTKSDRCPEAEADVESFAKSNLPGLTEFCKRRMQSFEFFSTSVVGASLQVIDDNGSDIQVPLHVQPRGVVEPLDWIIGRLEKKWRK